VVAAACAIADVEADTNNSAEAIVLMCIAAPPGFVQPLRACNRRAKTGEEKFFFEKKNQKTFLVGLHGLLRIWPRTPKSKSFLVLFFKKEHFPSFLGLPLATSTTWKPRA
jgi:hypothetical protein